MTTARASAWSHLCYCLVLLVMSLIASNVTFFRLPIMVFCWLFSAYFGYYAAWGLWMGYVPGAYGKWCQREDARRTREAEEMLRGER